MTIYEQRTQRNHHDTPIVKKTTANEKHSRSHAVLHPTITRSKKNTKNIQVVMLGWSTELPDIAQRLLLDRLWHPLTHPPSTQTSVSKCVLNNIAPRSCPYVFLGSETARVAARLSPGSSSGFFNLLTYYCCISFGPATPLLYPRTFHVL